MIMEEKKKRGAFFKLKPTDREKANREFILREQQQLFEDEKRKFAGEDKWNEYANGLRQSSTWQEAVEYYRKGKAECESAAKDWASRIYKKSHSTVDVRSDEDMDGWESYSLDALNEKRRRRSIRNLLDQAEKFESYIHTLKVRVHAL